MKFIVIYFLFQGFSFAATQSLPKLVQCLAQEEAKFHQEKYMGPMYQLNQHLVNLLAIENQLEFKDEFTEKICQTYNKAFELHSHLLLDHSEIFKIPKNKNEWEISSFARQVDLLISKNYDLFLQFVSQIQMEIGSPHCLSKIIENYDAYLEKEMFLKEIKSNYNDQDSLNVIKKMLDLFTDIEQLKIKCKKV